MAQEVLLAAILLLIVKEDLSRLYPFSAHASSLFELE